MQSLSFLYEVFVLQRKLEVDESALEAELDQVIAFEKLQDEDAGEERRRRTPRQYLREWAGEELEYLYSRRDPQTGVMLYEPSAEARKAIDFLQGLSEDTQRDFVGVESRFSQVVDNIERLVDSVQAQNDPEKALEMLEARRTEIDQEIAEIRRTGEVSGGMDSTGVKSRIYDIIRDSRSLIANVPGVESRLNEQRTFIQQMCLEESFTRGAVIRHHIEADKLLQDGDQGRSFFAFCTAMRSSRFRDQLQDRINCLVNIAKELGIQEAGELQGMITRLNDESFRVHKSYNRIAGQLRRVVDDKTGDQDRLILVEISAVLRAAASLDGDYSEQSVLTISTTISSTSPMTVVFPNLTTQKTKLRGPSRESEDNQDDVAEALNKMRKKVSLSQCRKNVREALLGRHIVSLQDLIENFLFAMVLVNWPATITLPKHLRATK